MNRSILWLMYNINSTLWLLGLLLAVSFTTVSCSETDGTEDPYADWEERNQHYIDSIATVAAANQGDEVGQWRIVRSYKLPPLGMTETGNVNDNVYCKILAKGEGTFSPLFTDSVDVHYRGQLIPLTTGQTLVFDQSYKGELDVETDVTVGFWLSQVVSGWTTALQAMKEGDQWELYLPHQLAYGESGNSSGSVAIPGYSTLIFTVYLDKIIPLESKERSISEEVSEDE